MHRFDQFRKRFKKGIHMIFLDLTKNKIMLITIAAYVIFFQIIFHKSCPVALLTGFPCPGCGMTRAFIQLVTLHWAEAFNMNPAIFLWFPLLTVLVIKRYFFQSEQKGLQYLIIIVGLLTLMIYIIRMILLFPVSEPLTYYEPNLLHSLLQLFRSLFKL